MLSSVPAEHLLSKSITSLQIMKEGEGSTCYLLLEDLMPTNDTLVNPGPLAKSEQDWVASHAINGSGQM